MHKFSSSLDASSQRTTATHSTAPLYQILTSSSVRHSFSNAGYIFVRHIIDKQTCQAQSNHPSFRFVALQDIEPDSTLESLRSNVKRKTKSGSDYHLYYNQKCLTRVKNPIKLKDFRNQEKMSDKQSIISFFFTRNTSK